VVPAGAVVRDSIVMHDTRLGEGTVVDRAILDKEVRVGAGAIVGHGESDVPNRACPEHLASGLILVGKGAAIPEGLRIGRNARIGAFVDEAAFTDHVPAGGVVDGRESMH
jgi:glucose-1-phosphate adenylyltransferase